MTTPSDAERVRVWLFQDTPRWLAKNGFVMRGGQQFYNDAAPNYVWPFEEGDSTVRVRHTDGAEVLYPASAFDYIVVSFPEEPK